MFYIEVRAPVLNTDHFGPIGPPLLMGEKESFIVLEEDMESAITTLLKKLPEKDPDVLKALNEGLTDRETPRKYFELKVWEVPKNAKITKVIDLQTVSFGWGAPFHI
ncbi:MAG: hypothetical protein AAB840_02585 [Patescibacteria group bacterium]